MKKQNLKTKTCQQCGIEFIPNPKNVNSANRFCSLECYWIAKRGRTRDLSGTHRRHIEVRLDDGTKDYLHRVIVEEHLGRRLKEFEIVHHIDLNKQNNDYSNLHVYESQAEHLAAHDFHRSANDFEVSDTDFSEFGF